MKCTPKVRQTFGGAYQKNSDAFLKYYEIIL